MLPLVPTAQLMCLHGAPLMLTPNQTLVRIMGGFALVAPAPAGAVIAGCPNINPQAGLKPCLVATPAMAGQSTLVSIMGRPMCLDTTTGLTDGTPVAQYRVVDAGQHLVSVSA